MRLFHFSILPPTGNFGDDALTLATKRAVERAVSEPVEWVDYPVRNHTSDAVIRRANECDAVLVGGGGLLLCDTAPNSYSGWQWACSLRHLAMIEKPIVVLAIGYNRFRGQPEFKPVFSEHLRMLVDKAAFFSVRNSGSKRALEHYGVDPDKVHVVPCPSIFHGAPTGRWQARSERPTRIGVNLAGDRLENRLSGCSTDFPGAMRAMVDAWWSRGWEVSFINHNWKPESNCQPYIDACKGTQAHVYDIDANWGWEDVNRSLGVYMGMDAVVAMRGHAQMIPFGLGVPVCSLITHDKLAWFLEDADMADTGVDVREPVFWRGVLDTVDRLLEEPSTCARQKDATVKLRKTFDAGMQKVRAALS